MESNQEKVRVEGPYGAALNLPLDRGDAGIDQTAAAMTALVHSAAASPIVQEFTRRTVQLVGSQDDIARAVYWAVKTRVEFKKDPAGVELLRHPDQLVAEINARARHAKRAERRAGADCDDVAMLVAAMLLVLGIDAALVVMAPEPGDEYKHVYAAARQGQRLFPIDPQETIVPGTERKAARRKAYPV